MIGLLAKDYGTTTVTPADFDAFWEAVLTQAAKIPLNATIQPIPLRSTEDVEVFDVRYDSLDHVRIACWYCLPRKRTAPLPVVIIGPGYVNEPSIPKATAALGYAALSLAPRGKLRSNDQFNPGYPGLMTYSIIDRNTYSYRGFYVDAIRAVDFVLSRPEVDPKRIGASGHSQGGALTLLLAAMRNNVIACAAASAPYYCGFMDAARLTRSYHYQEITDYLRMFPERTEQVRETLSYFDLINFAPRIACPIIVSIGLRDDIAPPEMGYAVFKAIGSRHKTLYEYDNCMHDTGSARNTKVMADFLREHLHPGEPRART